MRQTLRRLFPRSVKYDQRWALENSLGENVLYNTETLCKALDIQPGMKVLDLGCGKAASSIFIAREFGCKVWAVDSTVDEEENFRRIRSALVEDKVTPLKADAKDLPFEREFFDLIVAIDSYMYYGTNHYYLPYVARFLKPGGKIAVLDAGFKREVPSKDKAPGYLRAKLTKYFRKLHSVRWWRKLWEDSGRVRILKAEEVPEGEVILKEYVNDYADRNDEREIVETIKQDRGRLFTIIRLVAEKVGRGTERRTGNA